MTNVKLAGNPSVPACDGKLDSSQLLKKASIQAFLNKREDFGPKPTFALDGHLPNANAADQWLIPGVRDQIADASGQLRRLTDGPGENVGIKQKAHGYL